MNIHTALKVGTKLGKALAAYEHNPREVIGGNNPPAEAPATLIERARDFYKTLSAFLQNTPVIQSHEEAKQAAEFIEASRRTLGEMEDERKTFTVPLNAQLDEINERYKAPKVAITGLLDEIKRRNSVYAKAEEAKREAASLEARRVAEAAEAAAREAERVEADAKACADVGECDVNVAGAIAHADQTFSRFKRDSRTAVRLEKQIPVRLNGGFGRAVSMRKSETLILDDAVAAITAMGVTEAIRDAILSSARAHRKLHGSLPAGVSAETDRKF